MDLHVTNHNAMSGKQGGTTDEFYHLTSSAATFAESPGTDAIANESVVAGVTATNALDNLRTLGRTGGAELLVTNDNYQITNYDGTGYVYVSTGDTDRTITLPSVFNDPFFDIENGGRLITIKKVDSGTGAVIIEGKFYGTGDQQNIDGEGRRRLDKKYNSISIKAEEPPNTSWRIITRLLPIRTNSTINGVEEDVVFIGPGAGGSWVPGAGYNDLVFVGICAGENNIGTSVVAAGEDAGQNNEGNSCAFVGEDSGRNNTGDFAYFFGRDAGWSNDGDYVVGIGQLALRDNEGQDVVGIGRGAAANNTGRGTLATGRGAGSWVDGNYNIYIGEYAGQNLTGAHQTGTRTIGIGHEAARYLIASDCVALGGFAGQNNTTNNRLFIHSSAADVGDNALITGDFSALWARIYGDLIVTGEIQSESAAPIILNADTTGAIQADSGGNVRGDYAVDLQKNRWLDTQVASGIGSFIAAGEGNIASGDYSHSEGDTTTASGDYSHAEGDSTIASGVASHAEGASSTASGDSSHAEGSGNTASGDYSHAEGEGTEASGDWSHAEGRGSVASSLYAHAEGRNTLASGVHSHAEGYETIASGPRSHVSGYSAKAKRDGEYAMGFGKFNNNGDRQYMRNHQGQDTTDAVQATMTADTNASDVGNSLVMPAETTWAFDIQVAAYNDTDKLSAGYFFKGVVRRNAADGTVLLGIPDKSVFEEGAMSGCDCTVEADDTTETLKVLVTGLAGKTIRWAATIRMTQVSFGTP